MAQLRLKIPAIQQSFYKENQIEAINNVLGNIGANYYAIINNIANITNVPYYLLKAFIFIESGGNPNVISSAGAVGLMQIAPISATDIVWQEANQKRLNSFERNMLIKYIGAPAMACIEGMQYRSQKRACNGNTGFLITKQHLLNPELNILIGAIYIGILIDEESSGGQVRLDRVVVRYNRGYFNKKGLSGSITDILANMNNESRSYIVKLLGKNGLLDILI
jgi:soluble lytic murein transglycosylase-like protein